MEPSALHSRLETAAGDLNYRHLGELTATNPETVRRYMQGHAPSVEFLTGFCSKLGISAAWLLTGQGPMLAAEVKGHVLKSAGPTDLLGAMAEQLAVMRSRLERVEVYVQTLETRVRAAGAGGVAVAMPETARPAAVSSAPGGPAVDLEAKPGGSVGSAGEASLNPPGSHHGATLNDSQCDSQSPARPAAGEGTRHDGQPTAHPAADRIADAVAKRPPAPPG